MSVCIHRRWLILVGLLSLISLFGLWHRSQRSVLIAIPTPPGAELQSSTAYDEFAVQAYTYAGTTARPAIISFYHTFFTQRGWQTCTRDCVLVANSCGDQMIRYHLPGTAHQVAITFYSPFLDSRRYAVYQSDSRAIRNSRTAFIQINC